VGGASLAIHLVGLALAIPLLKNMPQSRFQLPVDRKELREATTLVAPPVPTQRAPNLREPSKEFDISSLPPRPQQPQTPPSPGAAARPRPRFVVPPTPKPGGNLPGPNLNVPEAPTIDVAQNRAPGTILPPGLGSSDIPAPPPRIQEQEKPKLAFERPGSFSGTTSATGRLPLPRAATTIEEAGRQAARGGGRGMIVGDEDQGAAPAPGSPAVPFPGKLGSSVELLSDAQGVDFWPYMLRVLSAVRRNWYAVIPESARLGRRGLVTVQFAISKDGSVRKVVFGQTSGTEALDRAAVAAISASNPFPPLPGEYRGPEIRLQFAFRYNMGGR
jgi:TonB family protein